MVGLVKKACGVLSSRIAPSSKNDAVGNFAGKAHFVRDDEHGDAGVPVRA